METQAQPTTERYTVAPRIVAADGVAVLYDLSLPVVPTPDWFRRETWQAHGALHAAAGGRGGVALLETPVGRCVWRHYRRGGWMRPLGDRYLYGGQSSSRGFAEFRLLAKLFEQGLPVPAPIAARCVRHGIYYTADLITRAIQSARTLAELVADGGFDAVLAQRVGALIARFHAAGVDHADLNAHNILVAHGALWLIDFDRGEIRATGTAWKLANLARLKRSLLKVGACDHDEAVLDREIWAPLMHGYEQVPGAGR